eukprot:snap_masked-scaffold_48-processed-gene-0.6-mRNA-1 protein AED:1.00 eAED:1.00 QI:0/0/0/0/1/1/2/0/60
MRNKLSNPYLGGLRKLNLIILNLIKDPKKFMPEKLKTIIQNFINYSQGVGLQKNLLYAQL